MSNGDDKRVFDNSTEDYKTEEDTSGNIFIFRAMGIVTFLLIGSLISYGFSVPTIVLLLMDVALFMVIFGIKLDRAKYKKRTSNDKLDIVGLADDKEFNNFDLNNDGYVDLYEYYTKSEDEVEKLIKEKCPTFSKNEFYNYIKKSIFIIENGLNEGDYEAFSGYLNYSYYRRLKNKIRVKKNSDRVLNKIVGVVLKDCILDDNIMTVKVAITLNYKTKSKNEVFVLTYINNLKDNFNNNDKCFNCGAALEKGICSYCDTYNYFAYNGLILSDKVAIRISGD